jgi:hypothetical protein
MGTEDHRETLHDRALACRGTDRQFGRDVSITSGRRSRCPRT